MSELSEIDFSGETNETLAQVIFLLGAEVAEKEQQVKAAKRELARRYEAMATPKAPTLTNGLRLGIRPTRRFDPATAQENLSAAKHKQIALLTANAGKAKELLSPAEYKLTQKTYGLTITVTMPEDKD